ncbi:MAG: tRNA (adenosine(37)-N6)-threonylcarbamoyltransferase complex dimerization subunit type 1 TsaB, partial [Candidatus Cloacimonetes bacterium]|nr:tRNA (adenosine(37)-N6)-threonylcarbamoyltransferase complex dimerization subunit type 1 TsaB [Candidatus Cloacimonadota bacterium]
MNILAIDTSSSCGSIAISNDNNIRYISYLDLQTTHSERLMPQIDYGLKQAEMKINQINLVAYSNGPGSFTGIRIGLATAKGICFALGIPLVSFNTLEILAYSFKGYSRNILAFMDARMNEVYAALYTPELKEIIAPCN